MIRNFLKRKKKEITHVYLDENTDYVFCFKRRDIIEDVDCDYHEHNKKMEKQGEIFKMTHSIRTMSGRKYQGDSCVKLCCFREHSIHLRCYSSLSYY